MRDGRLVEEPEVPALEEAPLDAADDRHAELLEFALVQELLALADRLAKAADERALGQTGAEVPRIDHVGKVGIRLHQHDVDARRRGTPGQAPGARGYGLEVGVLAAGEALRVISLMGRKSK